MIRLSRHIEILLLSNDCVIVPGFGGFMAHHVDARKDLSDGSFLPPMRSIGFNPKLTINDSLLAQSYVEAYDISYPEAVMRIEDEVRELGQHIDSTGSYDFKGVGKVSLNNDGNYEFTPCEAGLLTPSLYGLGCFQINTLFEIKNDILSKTHTQTSDHTLGTSSTDTGSADETDNEKRDESSDEKKHSARIIAIWRNAAVACIAIILFLMIPSPLVNNAQMAGNAVDTSLLIRIMPKDITTGQDKVSASVAESVSKSKERKEADKAITAASSTNTDEPKANVENAQKKVYSIVLASRITQKNASNYVEDLHKRGYDDAFVYRKNHVKVLLGKYDNRETASKALNKLTNSEEFSGAWITDVMI